MELPVPDANIWLIPMTPAQHLAEFKEKGYTVFRRHVTQTEADIMTDAALRTLFEMAFKREKVKPEVKISNLKYFFDHNERKKLQNPACIWANGDSITPLCSKTSGSCYGSYIPEVQRLFTMTADTYTKISDLYETAEIGQIFGPKAFNVRFKGGYEHTPRMDVNLQCDFSNVSCKEKIITQLVTSVDEYVPVDRSGSMYVIPGFHKYKQIARMYFNFVGGIRRLPLSTSNITIFDKETLEEDLAAFNEFLTELYDITAGHIKPDLEHERYISLSLPEPQVHLKWEPIIVRAGDMVCRSQWLPYYESACHSHLTPYVAFKLNYYVIPDDFHGSYKQRRLMSALRNGHVMEECQEWEKTKNNTYERKLSRYKHDDSSFMYIPDDDEELELATLIQCIDSDFLEDD